MQGAILRDDRSLLLLRYRLNDGTEFWLLPGGGPDPGESDVACVEREMREETLLDVEAGRLLLDVPALPADGTYRRWRTYECRIRGGSAEPGIEPGAESTATILALRWLPLGDIVAWGDDIRRDAYLYPQLVRVRAALGLPEPLAVREATDADAHGIATAQVLSWRVTYRGIIADEYIDALTIEAREATWAKVLAGRGSYPQISFVAVDSENGILGFISGGANREPRPSYDAELFAIYLLPEAERHGLGRRLVQSLAAALLERGHTAMEVRVLATNPACRFYESLGAHVLERGVHEVGGMDYPDVRYGWPRIEALVR